MIRGLPASLIIHAAVLLGGTAAWPYLAVEREEITIVPIDLIVNLDEVTNVAPIIKKAEPEDEPDEPEEQELDENLEEVPEDVDPDLEEDTDEVDTTDQREALEQPAPEEDVEELPDPDLEEEPEEDKPEPEEDKPAPKAVVPPKPDPLDALLNDSANLFDEKKDQKRAPPKVTEKKILEDEKPATRARRGAGDRSRNTARVEALILSQMKSCWDDVVDLPNPERLVVTVSMKLKKDGRLDGDVTLVKPRRAPIGDRPMGVAIERALRASRKCAPYRLPPEAESSYDDWKNVTMVIGPNP